MVLVWMVGTVNCSDAPAASEVSETFFGWVAIER
jgi:hypothetical protein